MGGSKKLSKRKRKAVLEKRESAENFLRCWVLDAASNTGSAEVPLAPIDSSSGVYVPVSWKEPGGHVIADLHSHSTCSDGLLSPQALVARAFRNKVNILALTDHDTFAGVPAAIAAASTPSSPGVPLRIIPGIEVSAIAPDNSSVHILGYFGSCGPVGDGGPELLKRLAGVRDGRHTRARAIIERLRALGCPVEWDRVLEIAGPGVAPARPHIARALVEAGHVAQEQEAFTRYIGNDGPAYASGEEIPAEDAVRLIREAGGVSVLAHPWSLREYPRLVARLAAAGLHGIEVYKDSGKLAVYGSLADEHGLLKVGGSDFHGRDSHDETELGRVEIPPQAMQQFLATAEPIWDSALRQLLVRSFTHKSPTPIKLAAEEEKDEEEEDSERGGRERKIVAEIARLDMMGGRTTSSGEVAASVVESEQVFDGGVAHRRWPRAWGEADGGGRAKLCSWLSKREVKVIRVESERLGLMCGPVVTAEGETCICLAAKQSSVL